VFRHLHHRSFRTVTYSAAAIAARRGEYAAALIFQGVERLPIASTKS
jgi:hypothetical protein